MESTTVIYVVKKLQINAANHWICPGDPYENFPAVDDAQLFKTHARYKPFHDNLTDWATEHWDDI